MLFQEALVCLPYAGKWRVVLQKRREDGSLQEAHCFEVFDTKEQGDLFIKGYMACLSYQESLTPPPT